MGVAGCDWHPPGNLFMVALVRRWIVLIWFCPVLAVSGSEAVDFAREIRPLLNKHCAACHGGVKQASELSFVYRDKVLSPAKSGKIPVVPRKPDESELVLRVTTRDENERMPPPEHGPRLEEAEIARLRQWVQEGAPWKEHWAFLPPKPQSLPQVNNPDWCRQPMDCFILERLEQTGLQPSPEADRLTWLRRVTFDLIGLPPSLDEARAFVADESKNAHEKVADRLLASPRFGERWAALWLDLARYADSQGYEKDSLRTMWPYRDWLIRVWNADMPYDQFTIRQIAGDLLPEASMEDRIATGFHRNTPTNSEGGTDDEEFRVVAVIDRVNTTWQVWQGITFGCVQCHSHPYDPIEHDEYYRFLAYFNTSRDWDLRSDDPRLSVPLSENDFTRARELDRRMSQLRREELDITEKMTANAGQWQPLKPDLAASTKLTELVVTEDETGAAEVLTEGTVSHDSRFTLEFPLPEGLDRLTALRIGVLPRNMAKAPSSPELGFTISHLRAQVVTSETAGRIGDEEPAEDGNGKKGGKENNPAPLPGEILFAVALGDELEPFDDPQATLNADKPGWGAIPRIMHPRRLVLVPPEPVSLPRGARLRLVIRQENAPNDLAPLVMNRSRYAITANDAWTTLVKDKEFQRRRDEIKNIARERSAIKGALLPVMAEQEAGLRRQSAVFVRGNWLEKGSEVSPGLPGIFSSLREEASADRLSFARWLVSPENPLTARAAVNRVWEQLFGLGLVETLEDFGSSGQSPSHPGLLDFLALRFQNEQAWSRKKLLRELVLSATYRQTARVTSELRERDPRNRLLARGPRSRLSAEMVRDNALALAGLLSDRMHGPSVMPPQPEGIWRAARSNLKWEESKGEDRLRRAIYTYWRRSSPYPGMLAFDAPARLVCNPRRMITNTPLQALVTLNDPVYMEAAVGLARRMRAEGGSTAAGQVAYGYELATGRKPDDKIVGDLLALHAKAMTDYRANPELADRLAGNAEMSALALVANAILNLDIVLTK